MSHTIDSHPDLVGLPGDLRTGPESGRTGRPRWPLWGVLAGVTGLISPFFILSSGVTEEQAQTGVDVIDTLERGNFHIGFVLGLVSVMSLFVTAAGWRRWLERRAPDSIAGRTAPAGLTAVATVNIIFTALAGTLVLYLPGGTDEGWLSKEALFVNFTLLDFGSLLGWWGAMVAGLAVAAMSFGSRKVLPTWMGVVSLVLVLPPVAMFLLIGLPGLVGFTGPIWLVAMSIGQLVSRTADA